MIKRLKLMILSLSSLFLVAAPLAVSVPAYAALTPQDTHDALCQGSNLDLSGTAKNCPTNTGTGVTDVIRQIINILSVLVGAIAVVMIIIGGFRYVTSGGNPEQAKGARQTIIYAIIGLVIVALAQVIVHFVLNSVTPAANA